MEETTDVVLWEYRRTAKAVGFYTDAKGGKLVWLPLSQIRHIAKRNSQDQTESLVTIPCWLADRNDL